MANKANGAQTHTHTSIYTKKYDSNGFQRNVAQINGTQFQVALKSDTNRKCSHKSSFLYLRETTSSAYVTHDFQFYENITSLTASFFTVSRPLCAFVAQRIRYKKTKKVSVRFHSFFDPCIFVSFPVNACVSVCVGWLALWRTHTHTHKINQIELWLCTIFECRVVSLPELHSSAHKLDAIL